MGEKVELQRQVSAPRLLGSDPAAAMASILDEDQGK